MFPMDCELLPSEISYLTDQADLGGQWLQMEILPQLKQVLQRLDMVEDLVAATSQQAAQVSAVSPSEPGKLSTDSFIVCSGKPG